MPPAVAPCTSAASPFALSLSTARIVSLLPSHTDVLHHLSLHPCIVGFTHECHIPQSSSPQSPTPLTAPKLDVSALSPLEISTGWSALPLHPLYRKLQSCLCSFYDVDIPALVALNPTLILTHIKHDEWHEMHHNVQAMLHEFLPHVRLISSHPQSIDDIYALYRTISTVLHIPVEQTITSSESALQTLIAVPRALTTTTTAAVVQWSDPVYLAADWVVQLFPRTFQSHPSTCTSAPSVRVHVDHLRQCQLLIFAICAVDLEGCRRHINAFLQSNAYVFEEWKPTIVATDATSCFSRFALSAVVDTARVLREIVIGNGPRRGVLWDVYPL